MNWIPTATPPALVEVEFELRRSVPVIAFFKDGTQRVVTYEQWDGGDRKWFTDCSERWTVTDSVTHWKPLDPPPVEFVRVS